jgi:Pyruvate/2-oxoacid:ferredoxin oxidoreductase gamma subunit
MPESIPTLQSATDFVLSHASDDDLTRLAAAMKQRRAALGSIRTATLTTGATVRIAGIRPKYLNELTGQIARIDGKHATVTLDADSTDRLRYASQSRFVVPTEAASFDLRGVPLTCCLPTG